MTDIQRFRPPAELGRKVPATVVASSRVRAGRTEILAAPYVRRWALVEEVNRQARRGEIQVIRANPVWSHERGQWEVIVRRLREPAPRWRKPVLIGGAVLATLGGLFGAGWWMVTTLSGPALTTFLAATTAAFVCWVWAGHRASRTHVSVNVNVSVKR